jgi:DNA (cytosine-5)-methyltransferase 1
VDVGSLFSGIGGIDLGLERAGMRVAWACESDPYARAVLGLRFPGAAVFPDVRDLRADHVRRVDVLCGGFPCQDISVTGKGAGLAGARSGLWREYARIVRELRPSYVLVENVSALRSRGLGTVLGDLAACGYDAEWDCLPAAAFGAPHRRDRIFVVAYAQRDPLRQQPERDQRHRRGEGAPLGEHAEPIYDGPPGPVADAESLGLAERPHLGCDGRAEQQAALRGGDALADADGRRRAGEREPKPGGQQGAPWGVFDGRSEDGGLLDSASREQWASEPEVGRVADGVPARVDRLRCLGNAAVPQIAEWIGRRILAHAEGRPVT